MEEEQEESEDDEEENDEDDDDDDNDDDDSDQSSRFNLLSNVFGTTPWKYDDYLLDKTHLLLTIFFTYPSQHLIVWLYLKVRDLVNQFASDKAYLNRI